MINPEKVCVAADYGGTKLLIGAVAEDGRIIAKKIYKTGTLLMSEAVDILMDSLEDFITTTLPDHCEMTCIGAGLVGQINNGYIEKMYVKNVAPIPVVDMIQNKWHVPCAIDNDCKAAMTAEKKIGIGKITDDFLYINVGTGLSAGFVSGGHVVRGKHNNGGEIGFTPSIVDPEYTVEEIAAGRGMINRYKRLKAENCQESEAEITVRDIAELAMNGDPAAAQVMEGAATDLARLTETLVYTFSPEYIVFGGGVLRCDWLMERIISKIHANQYDFGTRFVRTQLDLSTIGLLGAAMTGFSALD